MKTLFLRCSFIGTRCCACRGAKEHKYIHITTAKKTFDAAVNVLTPAYCSLDISSRISKSIDVIRDCYNNTDMRIPENDMCIFEDQILKSFVDTYWYRLEQIGDDDPTAEIKFISTNFFRKRYDFKIFYFHRECLNMDQTIRYKIYYFRDRVHEVFNVLNEKCKKLRQ